MRTLRITALLALGLAFAYAFSDAKEETKSDAQPAKCCAKAAKEGKKCDHECCEKAAKDGKNCEHCGGKN